MDARTARLLLAIIAAGLATAGETGAQVVERADAALRGEVGAREPGAQQPARTRW